MEYIFLFISSIVSLVIKIFSFKKDEGPILIIRLDHLGDMVCSLSAINKLKETYPLRRIDILTGEWNASLLQNSRILDNVYLYNSPAFTRDKSKVHDFKQRLLLFRKLKKNKYTQIISFRDDYFCSFMSLLLFPSVRKDRGTFRIKLKVNNLINKFSHKENLAVHEITSNFIISEVKIEKNSFDSPIFFFSEEEKKVFSDELKNYGLSPQKYAVIHPGASWEYKRWNALNFKKTAEYLFHQYNLPVILLGTTDEKNIGVKISENDEVFIKDKIGDTSLRLTIFLILHSKIAVCNDSSLMHIAAQSGIPTIGLMGPGEIEKFSPLGKRVLFYHKKVECYPCKQIECKYPNNPCVNLISVIDVKSGIDKLLKGC